MTAEKKEKPSHAPDKGHYELSARTNAHKGITQRLVSVQNLDTVHYLTQNM